MTLQIIGAVFLGLLVGYWLLQFVFLCQDVSEIRNLLEELLEKKDGDK